MNAVVKHMIEIAGGLVIGSLASDGLDKVVKIAAEKIKKSKKEEA